MPQQTTKLSRRKALKTLTALTGVAALTSLPGQWAKPIIETGLLPAHAQSSLRYAVRAYMSIGGYAISVIDVDTQTELTTILTFGTPTTPVVGSDMMSVFVAGSGADAVMVIDATTNTKLNDIAVNNSPRALAVSSDGTRVYTANSTSNNVSVIDTVTSTKPPVPFR